MISVIVPVYNAETTLRKTVESVLRQTYRDLEIILVDDGSTDASPSLCDSFAATGDSMKCLHKQNGGVSSARNAGLDVAQGEYVAFVDSDDTLDECYFERLLNNHDADLTVCGFVSTEGIDFTPEKKQYDGMAFKASVPDIVNHPYLLYTPWGKLFKRSIINENHLRFDLHLRLFEDTLFVLTYLQYCSSLCTVAYNGYHYDGVWGGGKKYRLSREEVEYRCNAEAMALQTLEQTFACTIKNEKRCYCVEYVSDVFSVFTDKECCELYCRYHAECDADTFYKSRYLCPSYSGISLLKRAYERKDMALATELIRKLSSFITVSGRRYAYERKDEALLHAMLYGNYVWLADKYLKIYYSLCQKFR